jgi:hypothetical protein
MRLLPSVAYLRACFSYDPATGALTWRLRPREHFATARAWTIWNSRLAEKPAGCRTADGYYQVAIDNHRYQVHRVVWKYMTGDEPPKSIDHKDRDPGDNRWDQLREATSAEQQWNRGYKIGTSGFKGVQRKRGKWSASIRNNYTKLWLGVFDTPEEASAAYEAAAQALRGDFHKA